MKASRRLRIIVPAVALVLVGLAVLFSLWPVQLYKVTVLPSLGDKLTMPYAVNNRGQVVGIADIAGDGHLFLWDRENGLQDLGLTRISRYLYINDAGQIAGTMADPNWRNPQAFFWDPKEGKQMLGTLGGAWSVTSALNNSGQVVGRSDSAEGLRQAFIWDKPNGMRKLPQGGRPSGRAIAINDSGQTIGFVGHGSDPNIPCFWGSTAPAAGSMPPQLSPTYPGGHYLNNNGCVLRKTSHRNKDANCEIWTSETGVKHLFSFENCEGPLGFNDSNQVLYAERHTSSLERFSKKYFPPYTQLCLWDPKRGKIVLDDQIPRKMGKLSNVLDINNHGFIVGVIRPKGLGRVAGVLLEPIPDRWGK